MECDTLTLWIGFLSSQFTHTQMKSPQKVSLLVLPAFSFEAQ